MSTWRTHAEQAIAENIGRFFDTRRHSITWRAEIDPSPHAETVIVTGQVDDFEEKVEGVAADVARRLGSTVRHLDGMAETSAVIDGIRVVVWGVYDRDAFNALAEGLAAERNARKTTAEVRHAVA